MCFALQFFFSQSWVCNFFNALLGLCNFFFFFTISPPPSPTRSTGPSLIPAPHTRDSLNLPLSSTTHSPQFITGIRYNRYYNLPDPFLSNKRFNTPQPNPYRLHHTHALSSRFIHTTYTTTVPGHNFNEFHELYYLNIY